jgi:hypothetical protein
MAPSCIKRTNIMEYRYKERKIEVHTEPVGKRWDWWFVLDDRPPRHNAEAYAASEDEATAAALKAAYRVIDRAG